MGGLVFMSLCGEICFYCVSVARTARNCFSIGAGMPAALLFGISLIPSEVPIEYLCSLFLGKQGNHPSYKPCWWIVRRTLEEYEIYSKEQFSSALSLTLGFPKCWLHLSCWWQSEREGYFPVVDLMHRAGRAVICWITQPPIMSTCIVWLTWLVLPSFLAQHTIKMFICLGNNILFVSQQHVWLFFFFLKLLYLVSINYRGFAHLNVKLSDFMPKFMPYLLLCIFSPHRCKSWNFCTPRSWISISFMYWFTAMKVFYFC